MDLLDTARPWLVPLEPAGPSATPLLCFPHAGGSASYYFPWAAALAPDVAVAPVQYPGRYDRRTEPMPPDLQSLAVAVAEAVGPVVEQRPCVFFGHSMGAVLAYEVSRLLADRGPGPERLVVSGRRSPTCHVEETVHLADDASVLAELRTLGGQSTAVLDDPDIRALFLPVIRGDYALIENYLHRPGPALTCPLTILTGDADPRVTREQAEAWRTVTTGESELFVRPGGHFFLDGDRPFVTDLLRSRVAGLRSV
ncbi:MAG: alpha/beta fold hydrolase [Pseudonocardia sp.]|nr:alpha/beta fold hydrolase [Pseudonocardia sp.]